MRQEHKGLATECWQRASRQKEHRKFEYAQEFVTAAGKACGDKFLSTFLYAQVEEMADQLGISKWKPDVIAEEPDVHVVFVDMAVTSWLLSTCSVFMKASGRKHLLEVLVFGILSI